MKLKLFSAIVISTMAITSCSEDTEGIGSSLTNDADKLKMSTGVFSATSRSILADAVYARNLDCYIGKVKDPETGAYVKSEFTTQFNMLENYRMPAKSTIAGSYEGDIAADSCEIWLYFNKAESYGDSLAPVKLSIHELARPISDSRRYYSDYNPKSEGLLLEGGLQKDHVFTMANLTYADSIRNLSTYTDIARIGLNDTYTHDGKTYNNYGTYIMRSFYDHPEYFKNSYTFIEHVCPGFFVEVSDGLGIMAKLSEISMSIYYRYNNGTETKAIMNLSATPEISKTSMVSNDESALSRLVTDESCTYLKTPAGIFTEVTLPIDDIISEHSTDSLLSVSLSFLRQNSELQNDKNLLQVPQTILMVQKDSLRSFFEQEKMYDQTSSYIATLAKNAYSFTNIGSLVTIMQHSKEQGLKTNPSWIEQHPDWNKVVLVPIATTISQSTSGSTSVSSITNQMGLSSTQLVGGPGNPIKVNVIYARFKN